MSRVLVTGASGFLALHVVKQLVDSGEYIVRGTVRSLANEKKVKPLKELSPENEKYPLELVEADLMKKETWADAVKDCKYVIHVASPFPAEDPKDEMELLGPAVEGTRNVLEACAKTKGGVKRVVLTSSCAAIIGGRFGEDRVFTEEDWSSEQGSTVYEKSKRRAEKTAWELVKNLSDDEKFELCSINPGLILGPVLNESSCTSIEFIRGMLQPKGNDVIKMSLPISDVRDVAAAHVTAMTSPKAPGNRYITITECCWFEEVAKVLDEEFRPLGYVVPANVKVVNPSFQNKVKADNSKIKEEFGYQPRDLKTTILDMAYNLIESGFIMKTAKYQDVKGGKPA